MLRQASCVAIDGRAVMIEGPPGSGKSSLTLSLIDRGAMLVGDDGVMLEPCEDLLLARPPPEIAGKIELRNIGILDMPCEEAPLALVLQLDPQAPRFIDRAESLELAGVSIPMIRFTPMGATDAIRVEHALRLYGLDFST